MKIRHHVEFALLAVIAVAGFITNADPSYVSTPQESPWVTLVVAIILATMAADLIIAVWRKTRGPKAR